MGVDTIIFCSGGGGGGGGGGLMTIACETFLPCYKNPLLRRNSMNLVG